MPNESRPNEPPNQVASETAILERCNQALIDYRVHPRGEYVANLGLHLFKERFSLDMVDFMFDQASKLHDHYPSIAQMMRIAEDFRVRERFTPKAEPPPGPPRRQRKSPWNPLVERNMERLLAGEVLTEAVDFYFRKILKIKPEEVAELLEFYRKKDFHNPRAVQILKGRDEWDPDKHPVLELLR